MDFFYIQALSESREEIDGQWYASGTIIINNIHEEFVFVLESWSIKDYERQWREGLERIIKNEKSCLIVDARNTMTKPVLEIWALYKVGLKVFFMHKILTYKVLKKKYPTR